MKHLKLQMVGESNVNFPVVTIDGEPVKFEKEKSSGRLVYDFQSKKDSVKIELFRCIDAGGFFWFLTQLFFFLISVFGLFDLHRRERSLITHFAMEANLEDDSEITLKCRAPRVNTEAATIKANCETKMLYNEYVIDQKTKKLFKALTLTKVFLALAIVGGLIAWLLLSW